MCEEGQNLARARYAAAEQTGFCVQLQPWRTLCGLLTTELITILESAVREDRLRDDFRKLLNDGVKPKVMAAIAGRVAVNALATRRAPSRNVLAAAIGTALDSERRRRILDKQDSSLIFYVELRCIDGFQSRHKLLDRLCNERGISRLPIADRRNMGKALLFFMEQQGFVSYASGIPQFDPQTQSWLMQTKEKIIQNSVRWMPCVYPPREWQKNDGGFFVIPNVVSIETDQKEYAHTWSLNLLQSVAWKVDRRVLDVAIHCFKNEIPAPLLPAPPMEQHVDHSTREGRIHAWRKAVVRRHIIGERQRVAEELRLLNEASNKPMYHVWKCDFRGRMYPVPARISFHGDELVRGCLALVEKENITDPRSLDLFYAYGATLSGVKGTLQARIDAGARMKDDARAAARDPLGPMAHVWMQADKPWRMLAWCLAVLDQIEDKPTGLPVVFDMSSSALQIISILESDQDLAKASNVIAQNQPRDIYQEILTKALRENPEIAAICSKVYGTIDRSVAKAIIMPFAMGARRKSMLQSVVDWSGATLARRAAPPDASAGEISAAESGILDAVLKTLDNQYPAISCFRQRASQNIPRQLSGGNPTAKIRWKAPDGLTIHHNYVQGRWKKIETITFGKRSAGICVNPDFGIEDAVKSAKALAPNIIHSVDAYIARRALYYADAAYAEGIISVHDCFGSSAATCAATFDAIRKALKDAAKYWPPVFDQNSTRKDRIPGDLILNSKYCAI